MGAGFTLWPLLVAMVAGSAAAALWPLRSIPARLIVFGAHVAVSVALIVLMTGPRELWIIILGPGLLVAFTRFVLTLGRLGRVSRSGGP